MGVAEPDRGALARLAPDRPGRRRSTGSPIAVFAGRARRGRRGDRAAVGGARSPRATAVSTVHAQGRARGDNHGGERGGDLDAHRGRHRAPAGRGFSPRVAQGARVRAGDVIVAFDADERRARVPCRCRRWSWSPARASAFLDSAQRAPNWSAGSSPLMNVARRKRRPARPPRRAAADREWSASAVVGHADGLTRAPPRSCRPRRASSRADDGPRARRAHREREDRGLADVPGRRHTDARVSVRARGRGRRGRAARVVAANIETRDAERPADPTASARRSRPRAGSPRARASCAACCAVAGDRARPGRPPRRVHGRATPVDSGRCGGGARGRSPTPSRASKTSIDAAVREAQARGGLAAGDILTTHLALLHDPEIVRRRGARRGGGRGRRGGLPHRRSRPSARRCWRSGNPLLAGRAADLREIERRVLVAMVGAEAAAPELFEASILVADDIGVGELSRLPSQRIAGLSTARGGATSHVSILARALGIPALVAVGPALLARAARREVLLDALEGRARSGAGRRARRASRARR